jgi:hypothetical protein
MVRGLLKKECGSDQCFCNGQEARFHF